MTKSSFLKLILAVTSGQGQEAAQVTLQIGTPLENRDEARYRREVADLVGSYQNVVGKQMQVPQARVRFETYARLAHESTTIPLAPMEMPQTAWAAGGLMGAIARRQPVGAVAAITPYNFPVVNMAGSTG